MIKLLFLLQALVIVCLSCAGAEVQTSQISADDSAGPAPLGLLALPNSRQLGSLTDDGKPVENTLHVNVGPQTLKLKTSYLEKREPSDPFNGIFQEDKMRRHFSLLGTSSFAGSSLVGEGELTYGEVESLSAHSAFDDSPMLLRLGLKNHWRGLSYGADYRSFGSGFVSLAGTRVEQPRDEAELWGEHTFGPFKIRGSVGEAWERLLDVDGLRVTKSATTLFNFMQPKWGGTLASSYALIGQGLGLSQESTVLNTTLSGAYRPVNDLSLGPYFGIKEEWDQNAGIRIETPTTGFAVTYAPYRDLLKLTGGTSYARSFSGDRLREVSTLDTTAALDWKLGDFFRGRETLSFSINYNRQLGPTTSNDSQSAFGAMLRLKIAGF